MASKLAPSRARLQLRLYVAGDAPNSRAAITNIKAICAEHFSAVHEIEVIDLVVQPDRALADGIVVTPTLLKLRPSPAQRMVGNLSDIAQVLLTLDGK